MEKERRTKALVIVVMLIVVAGLTVAFASLSSVLNIKGTAYLDAAKWGIKFKNLSEPVKIGSANVTGVSKIEETKSAEITGINVSLSNPGDKVTYKVDLVNEGTINAKIDNIEKTVLTSEQQRYLTFKVTDKSGNEIKEGDILSAGETKNLTITVEFIKDLTKEDLPKQTSTISLSYKLNFVQTDEKKDTTTSSEVQNELPSGYKRVEYLESTGTQYIDTKLKMTTKDHFELDVKMKYTNLNGTQLFGSNYGGYFGLVSNEYYNNKNTIINANQIYKMKVIRENYKAIRYIDDIAVIDDSYTAPSANVGCFLFAISNYINLYGSSAIVYSTQIKLNDLEMNLIPCLDSDNKPCMYDTIGKTTFYNSGTGEFLYGNVID